MAEYLEKETFKSWMKENITKNPMILTAIDYAPSADAEPVVHGRWITHYRSGTPVAEGYVSTCCDIWNNRKSDYCPNCGAKMDEENSE
jgi:hypothetical protein